MDNSNQSNDFGSFLAGFIVGGLVGAAVALVLAPGSGEETRSQIVSQGKEWRDRVANRQINLQSEQGRAQSNGQPPASLAGSQPE